MSTPCLALGALALRDLHPAWLPPSVRPLAARALALRGPRRTLLRLLVDREPDAFRRVCICPPEAAARWSFALGPRLPPLDGLALRLGIVRMAGALRRTIAGPAVRRVRDAIGAERMRMLRAPDAPVPDAVDVRDYELALHDPAADLVGLLARAGRRELLAQARRVDRCLAARLRLALEPGAADPVDAPPVLPVDAFDPRRYLEEPGTGAASC